MNIIGDINYFIVNILLSTFPLLTMTDISQHSKLYICIMEENSSIIYHIIRDSISTFCLHFESERHVRSVVTVFYSFYWKVILCLNLKNRDYLIIFVIFCFPTALVRLISHSNELSTLVVSSLP